MGTFNLKKVFFEADLTHMQALNPTLTHSHIPVHMKPFLIIRPGVIPLIRMINKHF